ncbi:CCN family member 5-like [Osmerus eperlanus]|uniref:CCN family member 5-like n=1 Tax=Osmerus eperlanus TaxID=29151 RepID=UPI002E0E073C
MDRREIMHIGSLMLCIIAQVWCQLCGGPCLCPQTVPRCPTGVSLVLDGCRCCQVCARQEGEACTERNVCDSQKGLQCDHSASLPGGPGECVSQNALGCEVNGRRLEEGQTFQPSCAQLCHCLGGGVTCVPLCSDDLQMPAANCPTPQLVRLPGRCCKEWVCNILDNSIYPETLAVERPVERPVERSWQDFGPSVMGLNSNCIEQMSDWSPCSRSCGPGVSTRTSNKNWACLPLSQTRLSQTRLSQTRLSQTRLCQVRLCQATNTAQRLSAGAGACESSYRSPVPVRLEHLGCLSTRTYRPRYCGLSCPDKRCCIPYRTRTAQMAFRCPRGKLTKQQVMMIESCSCHHYNCPQPVLLPTPRRGLPWF